MLARQASSSMHADNSVGLGISAPAASSAAAMADVQAGQRPGARHKGQRQLTRPGRDQADATALERTNHEFEPAAVDHRDHVLVGAQRRAEHEGAGMRLLEQLVFEHVGNGAGQPGAGQLGQLHPHQGHITGVEHHHRRTGRGQGLEAASLQRNRRTAARRRQQLQHRVVDERTLAHGARGYPDRGVFQRRCCHTMSTLPEVRTSKVSLVTSTRSKRTIPRSMK
jgi:hypothetical protein